MSAMNRYRVYDDNDLLPPGPLLAGQIEVIKASDHDSALAAKDAVIAEVEARLDDDRTDARRWRALCRLLGGDDHLSIDVFIGNSGCLEADAARYRHEIGNMGWDIYGAGDLTRFIDLYRVAALQVSASPTADQREQL